jgi:peptidoglycan hydrolase-like protein with peptidoglycan-binding domain
MKNIILEELNKAKLLMLYNTKVTLSENLINNKTFVSNGSLLTEQPVKTFLMSLFGTADDALIASLKQSRNAKYLQGIKFLDDVAAQAGFRSGDEIATAMAKGTLKTSQIGPIAKALLKKGRITGPLRKSLTDKAANLSFKKFPNMSGQKIKNDLIRKGYDPTIADEIAVKIANKNLPKNIPVKPTDVDDALQNLTKPPVKSRSTWTALKQWGIGAGLSIGVIALLYSYFNDGDVEDVVDTEETTPSPQPAPQPRTSQYKSCPEVYPIKFRCKNETIAKVQECLGVTPDGKFGPKTQQALINKGYDGNSITTEITINVCGQNNPNKPPVTTPPVKPEEIEAPDNTINPENF